MYTEALLVQKLINIKQLASWYHLPVLKSSLTVSCAHGKHSKSKCRHLNWELSQQLLAKDGPRWWLKAAGLVSTRDFSHSGSVRCHTPWWSSERSRTPSSTSTATSWLPQKQATVRQLNCLSLSRQDTLPESSVPLCPILLTLWSRSSTSVEAMNQPLSKQSRSMLKLGSTDSGKVLLQESLWSELSLVFSGGSMIHSRLPWVSQQPVVVPQRNEGDEHGSNFPLGHGQMMNRTLFWYLII